MLWRGGAAGVKGCAVVSRLLRQGPWWPAAMASIRWLQPRLAVLRSPLTVGVRAIVLDPQGRVFLVRHSYVPGWHLPGGGVEVGETVQDAMRRELREEGGLLAGGEPALLGVYLNRAMANRDHVAVFVVRETSPMAAPPADWEIEERGFFSRAALPEGTTSATLARLAEALDGAPRSETW